jgi:hypothetical protein
MWAYDATQDRWRKLVGEVPTGFYLSADIAPDQRLIVLATNTRTPGDKHSCNVLFPVRTTYGYRIDKDTIVQPDQPAAEKAMPKRPAGTSGGADKPDPARQQAQAERLRTLAVNQWTPLTSPGRTAPTRTWGSATLDSDRGRILSWGGGHCGYGGSDVDAYDVEQHTWLSSPTAPDYPHRQWNLGVRLAGVTFDGNPWTVHGRKIFAYDPTSRQMIMVRNIQLMTGYIPERLRDYPGEPRPHTGAKVVPPTWYVKYATWTFDPDRGRFEIVGPAPLGVDTLVTTKHGVLGLNVDWPRRDNDAGYNIPWTPDQPPEEKALFAFDSSKKTWKRLGDKQVGPQNLYELTSLAYDSQHDQVLLHGGGARRDELWIFDLKSNQWQNRKPKVAAPAGAAPPMCNRETVYLPSQDVMLTYGPSPEKRSFPALWAYQVGANAWYRIEVAPPPGTDAALAAGQNRALVYDAKRDLVLLVLGTRGDQGQAQVFAMRYRHDQAKFVK